MFSVWTFVKLMNPPTWIWVTVLEIDIEVMLAFDSGRLSLSQGTNAPNPIFRTPTGIVRAPPQSLAVA
jgi:hypothetical protein